MAFWLAVVHRSQHGFMILMKGVKCHKPREFALSHTKHQLATSAARLDNIFSTSVGGLLRERNMHYRVSNILHNGSVNIFANNYHFQRFSWISCIYYLYIYMYKYMLYLHYTTCIFIFCYVYIKIALANMHFTSRSAKWSWISVWME